ncbi:hypothetical protein THRCLA_01981 [Thraustotheca clavata]|uniref:WDR59/RTC1-like RING zinc finger domain-containing protein n=1 Tax=Thraustotheca clavata TaxID=74557 RepID=A0A1W0A6U7_9STRA|nr:hypothetical protein THRCLA_01981 [Thraustotheca clavata]
MTSNGKSTQLPRSYVGTVKFSDGIVGLNGIAPKENDNTWQSDAINNMIANEDNTQDNNPSFQSTDAATQSSMIMPDYNATLSVKIMLFDCSGFCGEFGLPLIKCADQAAQAAIAGHMELSQMWSMLAISSQNDEPPETLMAPWSAHPFGASLVQHVLELYERAGDVSMLAAIVCALDDEEETELVTPEPIPLIRPRTMSDPFEFDQKPIRKATSTGSQLQNLQSIASPRVDRPHTRTSSTDMPLIRTNTLPRSPVLSVTNYSFIDEEGEVPPPRLPAPTRGKYPYVVLLSSKPKDRERYDEYKHAYADVLYHYGALKTRCEMLKHLTTTPPPHEGLTLALHCHTCGHPTSELYCAQCKDFSIKCSVCELVVRGESMFCINCGHGGHRAHLAQWFETENACPTGCGCWCNQPTIPATPMPITPTSMMRANSY